MTDVIHLSTDELVKAINDEYGVILVSERNKLPKALAIGEKLTALRPRIAPKHGEWKAKFKELRLKMSYETATIYIRLYERQAEWRAKHADPTSLTIEEVLRLLAKPKPETSDKPKSSKAAIAEPGNEPSLATLPPDEQVKRIELDYGDMFEALKRKYDQDDLLSLTERLAAHLKMKLVPVSTPPEFIRRPLTAPPQTP